MKTLQGKYDLKKPHEYLHHYYSRHQRKPIIELTTKMSELIIQEYIYRVKKKLKVIHQTNVNTLFT